MKSVRLVGVFTLVLALLVSLGACQRTRSGTATQEETKEPQYGGTITLVSTQMANAEPPLWDIHETPSIRTAFWISPVEEYLFIGDVLNKGPRGTNEVGFSMYQAELPSNVIIGNVCESYDLSPDGKLATFHVRPGVMWQGNDSIGMKPREVTANDVAYMINRYRVSAKASKLRDFADENLATVIDKYTVELQFTKPFASWLWLIGYCLYCNFYPQEMVDAGANDWTQVTGTGPFKISDYVPASQVVYTKNEDWWNKVQVIDGKEYDTPFIDKLVYPIMPDEATRIAALIAGKLDIMDGVSLFYKDILSSACPELNMNEGPSGYALNLSFNCTNGPSTNLEFRRALMLGTDQEAIAAAIPGSRIGGFPFSYALGESIYTPIDKMPEEVAKLYSYDPVSAKQQIEALGYAGATIHINYQTTIQDFVTAAELLADQWKQLGLNAVLNPIDAAVYNGYNTGDGSGWDGVLIVNGGAAKTARGIENERSKRYLSVYTDQYFQDEMTAMMAEPDPVKRDAMLKEDAIYFIGTVSEIALIESSVLTCWWPWVKNYYGEVEAGCSNFNPMLATLWIDQDLKKSMGY